MHITCHPAAKGRFSASLDGETIVASSNAPFFAAARVLLERGATADEPLTMSHEGSATIALRSTIGVAADRSVIEEPNCAYAKYRPYGSSWSREVG
jgi:hypothetical protein